MINTLEKNQIRALLTAPGWSVVERLAQEVCDKISTESKMKETEWLTARTVVFDEGQKAGIKRLLNEIMNTQV
jgi:hypothetical protein